MKTNRHQVSLFALILTSMLIISCQKSGTKQNAAVGDAAANALTDAEKTSGWELLFDGTTLNGWKRYNHDSIGPLWTVKEGAIVCDGRGLGEGTDHGGSLVTTKQWGNFELSIEWKISPGGNSGILYHVVEKPEYGQSYNTGPEYQVLDDEGWRGKAKDVEKAGSNYDMHPAAEIKKLRSVGEWNTALIVYNNGHVEHWLNGEKIVEFQDGDADFIERYKKSKWVDYPGWNKFKIGAISLQDHGAPVYFRNIKIRAL